MTEPKQQTRETPLQQIVTAWHEGLTDPSRRGPRAELRRAKTLEEVVFTPAFHDLRRRLSGTRYGSVSQLALVAGIVAGVDRLDAQPVASRMADAGTHRAKARASASFGSAACSKPVSMMISFGYAPAAGPPQGGFPGLREHWRPGRELVLVE